MNDGLRMVQFRACGAWKLPGDLTCAGVARRLYRQVAAGLNLEPGVVDDGVTMVSELSANTLHAQRCQQPSAGPELWLYLRGSGPYTELVCKVFDTLPGWVNGSAPGHALRRAPADAMSGRGLEVVHELSRGRWGHHLSRARLAAGGLRGKAVWFAVPAEGSGGGGGRHADGDRWPQTAGEALTELERDLGSRGLHGAMLRADDATADMAVLSIASGLTVWCRSAVAWLRAPDAAARQWGYYDLVEVAEHVVEAYETSIAAAGPRPLTNATRTGALPGRLLDLGG